MNCWSFGERLRLMSIWWFCDLRAKCKLHSSAKFYGARNMPLILANKQVLCLARRACSVECATWKVEAQRVSWALEISGNFMDVFLRFGCHSCVWVQWVTSKNLNILCGNRTTGYFFPWILSLFLMVAGKLNLTWSLTAMSAAWAEAWGWQLWEQAIGITFIISSIKCNHAQTP